MFGKRRNERRRPENAELRQRFTAEQKNQAQQDLDSAQRLTQQTNQRIERLRDVARVLDMKKR